MPVDHQVFQSCIKFYFEQLYWNKILKTSLLNVAFSGIWNRKEIGQEKRESVQANLTNIGCGWDNRISYLK